MEGIRRVLEKATNEKIPKGKKLSLELIQSIRMGTTVATNALLERKGAKVLLVTTKRVQRCIAYWQSNKTSYF